MQFDQQALTSLLVGSSLTLQDVGKALKPTHPMTSMYLQGAAELLLMALELHKGAPPSQMPLPGLSTAQVPPVPTQTGASPPAAP